MKILFMGDAHHQNAISWIEGLRAADPQCEIEVWSLPGSSHSQIERITRITAWFREILGIKKLIRKTKPDIIIGYRLPSYGFMAACTGFHPIVVASQGASDVWPMNSWVTPIKKFMASYAIKKADMIHAWAQHMADNNVKLGADPGKILVLPRGIDTDIFYPATEPAATNELKMIVTRGLFPEYGHEVIIKAMGIASRNGVPLKLDVVGKGTMLDRLKELAVEENIQDKIVFHGRVENKKLPDMLRESNIYISMPISEGTSASLFEAMACGCFPIITDLPANSAWIKHGKNGYLLPVGDVDALAEALQNIWRDKALISSARKENIAMAQEKASLKKNMLKFMDSYKKLVAERSRIND